MPPLPTAEMPVNSPSPAEKTSDSLSSLRKKWSEKFQRIDAIPISSESDTLVTASKPSIQIPDLPLLGSNASRAAMSMDDLDSFLSSYHNQGASSQQKLPEMPFADAGPASAARKGLGDLPAFPHTATPEVAMPLAREFAMPTPPEPAPALEPAQKSIVPDLSDLRKTAPHYCKFSPDSPPSDDQQDANGVAEQEAQPRPVPSAEDGKSYTDNDLREALQPIIDPVVDQFLYKPPQGIHTFLEPMLRSTVRRAIAEQMEDVSPFESVAGWDKFAWKLRALFSSRSYDDIVFEYTRRYQVEEIFLLRPRTRSLISYASQDPVRHAKPEKVQNTVKKIAAKESEHKEEENPVIKWKDSRNLMIRRGKHCILAVIVHGPSNAILRADIDYALRQAEERFGDSLSEESDIHMQILQPLLEGCLLIQAPAIPN